jgi:replicative DNA helicase
MTDLRSSGEIEQKADVILFLHREDYYDPDTHMQGLVEVEVGKGRDIKTGAKVYLSNRYDQMRLDNYDDVLPSAPEPQKSTGWGSSTRNKSGR